LLSQPLDFLKDVSPISSLIKQNTDILLRKATPIWRLNELGETSCILIGKLKFVVFRIVGVTRDSDHKCIFFNVLGYLLSLMRLDNDFYRQIRTGHKCPAFSRY